MINKEKYPILEFDVNKEAKLDPTQKINNNNNQDKIALPEYCVITFFKSVIEMKKEHGELNQVSCLAKNYRIQRYIIK